MVTNKTSVLLQAVHILLNEIHHHNTSSKQQQTNFILRVGTKQTQKLL